MREVCLVTWPRRYPPFEVESVDSPRSIAQIPGARTRVGRGERTSCTMSFTSRLTAVGTLSLWLCSCSGLQVAELPEDENAAESDEVDPTGVGQSGKPAGKVDDDGKVTDPSNPNSTAGQPGSKDNPTSDGPVSCSLQEAAPQALRTLSPREYALTVRDLLGDSDTTAFDFPPPVTSHGFEHFAENTNPSPLLIERYQNTALSIAERVAADPSRVLSCEPSVECGAEFIRTFGAKAFRRPLTPEEVGRYDALFKETNDVAGFTEALKMTVAAFMQAPQFLYRIEASSGERLTGYELATRLSYLLWQSMPDDALTKAAADGELDADDGLEKQTRRMLDSPKASAALADFTRQWLRLDRIQNEAKSPDIFPGLAADYANLARAETSRFVELLYDSGELTVKNLFTSTRAVLDPTMAAIYGVEIDGDLEETELNPKERAGVLTRAAFLGGRAHNIPSPPLRGVGVLESVLCIELPPPPPNVDTSIPPPVDDKPRTNRQVFEDKLAASTACIGCHKVIDSVGYAFENYDAIGGFRTVEPNGLDVDPTTTLLGTDVDGPMSGALDLAQRLGSSEQVKECVTKNLYRFAFGREETEADSCKLEAILKAADDANGDLKEALVTIALSKEFTHRR